MRNSGRQGKSATARKKREIHSTNPKTHLLISQQGRSLLRCIKARGMRYNIISALGRQKHEKLGRVQVRIGRTGKD